MTFPREQIIEWAREAGALANCAGTIQLVFSELERLTALIEQAARADEREKCAKLADPTEEHRRDARWGFLGGEEGVELLDGVAAAIRARINQ